MDEKLKQQFLKQKIQDFINDHNPPIPTIICEMQRPYIVELVRQYCLYADPMIPYRGTRNLIYIVERLDIQQGMVDYGDLYIFVSVK